MNCDMQLTGAFARVGRLRAAAFAGRRKAPTFGCRDTPKSWRKMSCSVKRSGFKSFLCADTRSGGCFCVSRWYFTQGTIFYAWMYLISRRLGLKQALFGPFTTFKGLIFRRLRRNRQILCFSRSKQVRSVKQNIENYKIQAGDQLARRPRHPFRGTGARLPKSAAWRRLAPHNAA
jgi:hypothetical protein